MTEQRVVIVGASLAGGTAALTLREHGFDGAVTLVGAEKAPPYERPPLSKSVMQGERDQPDWVLADGEASAWAERDVTLRAGTRAVGVDVDARTVTLDDGDALAYDTLVLATGAEPRRLPIPGAERAVTLRSLDDALAIRRAAESGGPVALIGGSWIGCEVAASLRQHGCDVEILEKAPRLLPILGSDAVSERLLALHRAKGVTVTLGADVTGITDEGVRLADRFVEASVVVLATGVAPRLELARAAGLAEAAGGVAVSATLRTSDPNIVAIGDIAAVDHPAYGTHVRVEHWDVAQQHGKYLGAALTGAAPEPYTRVPYFFSDQYELGFEYRGWVDPSGPDAEVVIRGDDPAGSWYAFWLVDGAVQAVLNANAWDDSAPLWKLANERPVVAPERLRDPGVPLTELA
ncbi:NAD(P)/FAD-dependent oxidoreductase [Cryptosporangium aurantiacum]|uniref:3-phenylpropionate/trans-cinnamate dioxygenase ferredoxin reductase subunit n=1 Tax=Cryptosporangium aurantiacum TaxID=134849 RepID=A0A1M7KDP6_9ACTN|nr:FAD-dependent oxidoreductase [Cryptosporangium aurantiacum]SHM63441.1 3-phenylpropionate/trans-cinnamate dioxygenase ferredoxin reductase subunit [Cryptosporangium aurantiacum]